MKIETWLPCFSGFYESIWSNSDTLYNELDSINEDRFDNKLKPLKDDDSIEYDYRTRENDIGKRFTQLFAEELSDYIKDIKFLRINSPKAYNFSTDQIEVEVDLDINKIQEYIKAHREQFVKYLKDTCTSYDGFWSYYSNSIDEWESKTNYYSSLDGGEAHIILKFIARIEAPQFEIFAYEELMGNGCDVYNYFKNWDELRHCPVCDNCGKLFSFTDEDRKKYKQFDNPPAVVCYDCQQKEGE